MFFNRLLTLAYFYIRPFIKWFLHRFTRLCELQRICYGATAGYVRTSKVEQSLELSRNCNIKELIKELNYHMEYCNDGEFDFLIKRSVTTILIEKKIKPKLHPDFPKLFQRCAEQIWGYRRLMHQIEMLRITQYDCDNTEHENKLINLWNLLMPDIQLDNRVTKQWQAIGFQGDDPKTDFRGMGILGLENLLYFAKEYNGAARHVLLHSHHPHHGYTFAIVGINLTSMAYKLFKNGEAKTHFYNAIKGPVNIENFHKFYCYLFFEFDRFWVDSKPRNIMDFPIIHERFQSNINNLLSDVNAIFKMNLLIEDI